MRTLRGRSRSFFEHTATGNQATADLAGTAHVVQKRALMRVVHTSKAGQPSTTRAVAGGCGARVRRSRARPRPVPASRPPSPQGIQCRALTVMYAPNYRLRGRRRTAAPTCIRGACVAQRRPNSARLVSSPPFLAPDCHDQRAPRATVRCPAAARKCPHPRSLPSSRPPCARRPSKTTHR